jgi:hypothetical protein
MRNSVGAFVLATAYGAGTALFLSAPVPAHWAVHIFEIILKTVESSGILSGVRVLHSKKPPFCLLAGQNKNALGAFPVKGNTPGAFS